MYKKISANVVLFVVLNCTVVSASSESLLRNGSQKQNAIQTSYEIEQAAKQNFMQSLKYDATLVINRIIELNKSINFNKVDQDEYDKGRELFNLYRVVLNKDQKAFEPPKNETRYWCCYCFVCGVSKDDKEELDSQTMIKLQNKLYQYEKSLAWDLKGSPHRNY